MLEDSDIYKYRIVNKPSNIAPDYFKLVAKMDEMSPEAFEDAVENIVDEIETTEVRLKKAQIQYDLREKDQVYYQTLIEQTNKEIESSKQEMVNLQRELADEQRLKGYKAQFEEVANLIEFYPSAQDSMLKIKQCQKDVEDLDQKSHDEKITSKQKMLHKLVAMINEFTADIQQEKLEEDVDMN